MADAMQCDGGGNEMQLAEQAMNLCFNGQHDEAAALLSPRRHEHPRIAVEYAINAMLRGLSSSTSESREQMLQLFQAADVLAKKQRDVKPSPCATLEQEQHGTDSGSKEETNSSNPQNQNVQAATQGSSSCGNAYCAEAWRLECDVIYADAMLVRSITQLQMQQYVRGGFNLRKSWACYQSLMKEIEAKCAQIPEDLRLKVKFGCGIFFLSLSAVPAGIMRILSIVGFISDRQLGEQYLTEIANAKTIRTPHAAMVLLTFYLFLPTGLADPQPLLGKAKLILGTMRTEFPNNAHFHAYANFYYRKIGDADEALAAIQRSVELAEQQGGAPLLLQYLLADSLLAAQQFAAAKSTYDALLQRIEKKKEEFAYTGQVVLSLAACYVWLNDLDSAIYWIQRVKAMSNVNSTQDAASPTIAARFVAEPRALPLLGLYVLYINRDLAPMRPRETDRLSQLFAQIVEDRDLSPPEVDALRSLFLGVMHRGSGRLGKALECWSSVIANEKKLGKNSFALPYCMYEVAENEFRSGNHDEAKRLLDRGNSMKGDGHDALTGRYTIALREIARSL